MNPACVAIPQILLARGAARDVRDAEGLGFTGHSMSLLHRCHLKMA